MAAETEVLDPETGAIETETNVEELGEQSAGIETEGQVEEGDGDEVTVTIGEESPASEEDEGRAPTWVRELRKSHQELQRKNRELEQRLQSTVQPETAVVVGEKPTLEASGYDADKFAENLEAWHERKRAAEDQTAKRLKDQEKANAAWVAKQATYTKQLGELKVKDAEEVEAVARDILSVTQQGLIVQGAENKALVIYALGKNPKKCKELASIADPVEFAFAVAKLETQLKVTPRKAPPLPETRVRGSAAMSGVVDSQLERLRAEADRTGDRTKVAAYMRQKAGAK